MYGTISYTGELVNQVNAVMQAIHQTPAATEEMMKEAEMMNRVENIMMIFNGPEPKASEEELPPMPMPLAQN